jgi:hypothetical protein
MTIELVQLQGKELLDERLGLIFKRRGEGFSNDWHCENTYVEETK